MNISNKALSEQQTRSLLYRQIFFVLFFGLLVGCVNVSVSCKVSKTKEIASAVEDCKEHPNMSISKEF